LPYVMRNRLAAAAGLVEPNRPTLAAA